MGASLEVADVFRAAGPAYRAAHAGHLSLQQLKIMSAVEHCRTAALGGHVEACTDCGHWRIAYNSCRNRHCPKCQGAAARTWLATREADLLPVGYFHVVFTLPAEIGAIAFHNKALLYDLLFKAASETMLIIAADPKHLADRRAFLRHVSPVRNKRWVVYAKPPFAGPEAVLAYLARYTHRVAISNRRLIAFDEGGVTFRYKDYRRSGADRQQVMTLAADEFIRRFLLHNLPRGFHRIRHYGLLAGSTRKAHLERARQLLAVAPPAADEMPIEPPDARPPCPCCGGRMIVIETFERRYQPRGPPANITVSGSPAS
jgi:hypothetical protein